MREEGEPVTKRIVRTAISWAGVCLDRAKVFIKDVGFKILDDGHKIRRGLALTREQAVMEYCSPTPSQGCLERCSGGCRAVISRRRKGSLRPTPLFRFEEGGSGCTAHVRIDFRSDEEARQMMGAVHRQLKRDFKETYE